MSAHDHDLLPNSPGVAQLVRRIFWRLNAELGVRRHSILTAADHSALFNLGDASKILDRVALLPNMADAETRARRDLLELFDVFNPLDALEQTIEMPAELIRAGVQVIKAPRALVCEHGFDPSTSIACPSCHPYHFSFDGSEARS